MYIANVDENGFENNAHLKAIEKIALLEDAPIVTICNKLESEIAELTDDNEKLEFLHEMGMEEPGLNRLIIAGYQTP
jgi:ribosome-binding ATPase YchF (GTP1/OBG family)